MLKKLILTVTILILTCNFIIADPPEWTTHSYQYYMTLITDITLNGITFEDLSTNMAGAFGPGGEQDCRAIAMWQTGPDLWYFTIGSGDNSGTEVISFKIYDEETDFVYFCNETLFFEDNTTVGTWVDPYLLTVTYGSIDGLVTLVGGIGNIEDVLLTINGFFTSPDYSGYYIFESIPVGFYNIAVSLEGYQNTTIFNVEVFENQTTTVDIFLFTEMGIIEGNITLLTTSPPPGNIVDVEITAGDITVNPDENGFYQIVLTPGIYDVTAGLFLYTYITIEDVIVEENLTTSDIDITLIDWVCIVGGQYNMVVLATVELDGEYIDGSWSNQMASFGPGGYEDCRGTPTWLPYLDLWYFCVISNDNSGNEVINFKLYETETDSIYNCYPTVFFEDNITIGNPDEPFELTAYNIPLYSIQGTITNDEGVGIQYAEIMVCDNIAHSDINGNYTIYVPPGIYNVTASLYGYHSQTIEKVILEEGQSSTEKDFVLYSSDEPPDWCVIG